MIMFLLRFVVCFDPLHCVTPGDTHRCCFVFIFQSTTGIIVSVCGCCFVFISHLATRIASVWPCCFVLFLKAKKKAKNDFFIVDLQYVFFFCLFILTSLKKNE